MAQRMSDAAVQAKTGRTWRQWFEILDGAGAREMTHQQIVALLHSQYGVGPWWQQMVTVTYEQAFGGRDKHQMPDGYQVSVSRTVALPLERLYAAWQDEAERAQWLGDGVVVRSGTPNKTLRLDWRDGRSRVEARFAAKGPHKSQVTAQHSKLADAEQAAEMKAYWTAALERLSQLAAAPA